MTDKYTSNTKVVVPYLNLSRHLYIDYIMVKAGMDIWEYNQTSIVLWNIEV